MRALTGFAASLAMLAATCFPQALHAGSKPPADLRRLERQVSLEIAHARGIGPTDPASFKRLQEAERYDLKGEQALASGDYKTAEDNFLRAQTLIRQLGD
jgi:hypothetical protein